MLVGSSLGNMSLIDKRDSSSVLNSPHIIGHLRMADFVSEKKISEFQTAFFYFAQPSTGLLRAKQMGDVMRLPRLGSSCLSY